MAAILLPQFVTPEFVPYENERDAFARLQEFLALGRLRLVTSTPDAYGSQHYQANDPRYYELKRVTRLKVLDKKPHRPVDKVVAWADDECSVQGKPSAVLHRCTEWARFLAAEQRGAATPGPGDAIVLAAVATAGAKG